MNFSQVSQVRFIKLGIGGRWEKESIETDNPVIRLGYESNQHQECLNGNWEPVYEYWLCRSNNKNEATNHLRQIKEFYQADENTLWITFYNRKLYWCFVEKEVIELEDGSRIRRVKDQWFDTDLKKENVLYIYKLDGGLTQTQRYSGTICSISEDKKAYLIRKLKGEISPEFIKINQLLNKLKENILPLIQQLHSKDFELLTDLIFNRLGWQRNSILGETQTDFDLDIYQPILGKRAFVQVKSKTNRKEILDYIEIYHQYDFFQEFYFVYHTCFDDLDNIENKNIHLINGENLAGWVIQAGLVDWLLKKCA